ncbi:hypothetical protein QYF61_013308 [Mycteria americana]|uniref:Uncharacterized protein n=1 Tax=Mycteria americana TaxID=33587 RepID=A0AAN7MPD7_MYCAM|nr:hypothetical protein QYF61_013308 [Mycteria americana]
MLKIFQVTLLKRNGVALFKFCSQPTLQLSLRSTLRGSTIRELRKHLMDHGNLSLRDQRIAEQCLHSVKAFSAPHTAPPASRLGVHKKLGGDTAGRADPNGPKGYPIRHAQQ